MAGLVGAARRNPAQRIEFALLLGLLGCALAVGALTTRQPLVAVAIVLGAGVMLLVAANVNALPVFLVFTMFVESLSLGPGLRIGRVAGAMALAVLGYYLLARGRSALRPNALVVAAGAYGFWTLLSVYWADDSSLVYQTFFSYLLAIAYMLTFAVLVRTPRQLIPIFATLAIGSLVFGATSFVTYTLSSGQARAEGLQGDPNYFAVYQVISLPAALALAALERRSRRRLVYYVVIGVIFLSVVSSLSRTGLIALVGVTAASLLLPWRVFFRSAGQKVTYAGAIVLASALAIVVGSTNFVARAQSILNPQEQVGYRGSGRLDLWAAAVTGWHREPWLGLGAGNYQSHALDLLQRTQGVNTTAGYVRANRVVHNGYLETLTELGPVGLGLLIAVIGLTAWYFVRSYLRTRGREPIVARFSLALVVSLLGFALSSIFLSNQLGKPFWILVGLAISLDAMSRRAAPEAVRVRLLQRRRRASRRAAAPDYDAPVAPELVESEPRPPERAGPPEVLQERLERQRQALLDRERELRRRARELDELEERRSGLAAGLARATGSVAERERAVAAREARAADAEARLRGLEAAFDNAQAQAEGAEAAAAELRQVKATVAEAQARADEAEALLRTLEAELAERIRLGADLERRAAALAEREVDLAERETAVETEEDRIRALEVAEARARELEERIAAVEEELTRRTEVADDLETRSRELDRRARAISERERAADERELELRGHGLPAGVPDGGTEEAPGEAPGTVPGTAPPAERPERPEPVSGQWSLASLGRLVARHGEEFPARLEEWRYYLVYLRDVTGPDGLLPAEFDGLVRDVFGDLVGRP